MIKKIQIIYMYAPFLPLHRKSTPDQSDVEITEHIDSLLVTLSESASETYTTNFPYISKDRLLENGHASLLLESGLLVESFVSHNSSVLSSWTSRDSEGYEIEPVYEFFDPLLHEYTCALYYTARIKNSDSEGGHEGLDIIGHTLFAPEWKNVCVLVASMLGKGFATLLRHLDLDYMEDSALCILADSLHQSQCPRLCLRSAQRIPIPQTIDFSDLPISTSTLKGLYTSIFILLHFYVLKNQPGMHITSFYRLYDVVPTLCNR